MILLDRDYKPPVIGERMRDAGFSRCSASVRRDAAYGPKGRQRVDSAGYGKGIWNMKRKRDVEDWIWTAVFVAGCLLVVKLVTGFP